MKNWMSKLCFLVVGGALTTTFSFQYLNADEKETRTIAQENASTSDSEPKIDLDLISEAMGHLIAKNFKNPAFTFNLDKMIAGMKDELEGKPSPLTDEECQTTIALIQEQIFLKISNTNLQEANQFLETNSKQDGVVCIDSKIQYQVLAQGLAENSTVGGVTENSTPLIHYRGKLLDGTEFSASYDQDPIAVPMDKTIPGFSKGLLGMKQGEKRRLYIHPDQAYGMMGHLPPNSLLIFDVEVIQIDNSTASEESDATLHPSHS
jgi:peptidylprolyl isomerase